MKAEEYFDNYENFGNSVVNLYKQEIVEMLKNYAEMKCYEQKEICMYNLDKHGYIEMSKNPDF